MTGNAARDRLRELPEPDAPATLLVAVMARVRAEIDVAAPDARSIERSGLRERLSWILVGLGIVAVTVLWMAAGPRIAAMLAWPRRAAYPSVDDMLIVTGLLTALGAYMTGVLRLSGSPAQRR